MRISIMKKYLIIIFLSIATVLSAETIGRVMKSNGVVLIKPVGGGTYSVNVKPGQAVSNGDALRVGEGSFAVVIYLCLLYTSPSPRDKRQSRMPSSA